MATNLQFIKSATGSNVASVSVTDCFSAKYDVYMVSITKWNYVNSSVVAGMRFIDSGGSVISDSEYDHANLQLRMYAGFQELRATGETNINVGINSTGGNIENQAGFTAYIFNPYDSSSYTFSTNQDSAFTSSGGIGFKGIGVHKSAEQLSGVNFFDRLGGNISATINVYGVK